MKVEIQRLVDERKLHMRAHVENPLEVHTSFYTTGICLVNSRHLLDVQDNYTHIHLHNACSRNEVSLM